MTEAWQPENVIGIRVSRRERRRIRALFDASPPRRERLSGATVGVVLAAAVCAGLAAGLTGNMPRATAVAASDQPILWGETQRARRGEVAAEDQAWAGRSGEGGSTALRQAPDERVGGADARVSFSACKWGGGTNCVVDGDTIYLNGAKIRIAGIDAPETHDFGCADELARGDRAAERLRGLLNSGSVSLTSIDRDEDRYGRKLRNVAVSGTDVGETLIGEGLARDYAGGRRPWC